MYLMSELPTEAEKLLAGRPEEFVAERQRVARALRDAGRAEDAEKVAGLRKPSAVVFAVNRAARDRPQAAKAAVEAARRVQEAQVGGDPDAFGRAFAQLSDSLDLLADVAIAHVAPRGKSSSEPMRRRVRDLLRSAVAEDDAREALRRGALVEERGPAGFSSFAGVTPAPSRRSSRARGPSRKKQQREAKRREREDALQAELGDAEKELKDADQALRAAERRRTAAERAVASVRARLERLDR
jgi:hypothetical protein